MLVTPTLHFFGQCEAAIGLYQKAFNCKVEFLSRYSEADIRDWSTELTAVQKNWVYHAEVKFGSQRVMMADEFAVECNKETKAFLTMTFDTADDVRKAFDVLCVDSTVIYPPHSTTYSSCTCSLIDKFGIRWGMMTEQTER